MSSDELGNGPGIPMASDIVFDGTGNRLLVVDTAQDAMIAIEESTGDRTFVAQVTAVGEGPNLVAPRGVTRKYDGTLVVDAIYKIPHATGNRNLRSGPTLGTGPLLVNPRDPFFTTGRPAWP